MCPLRYVVFFVSALVALAVLMCSSSVELVEADESEKEEKTSIVDFFTGRYLYNKWSDYRKQKIH